MASESAYERGHYCRCGAGEASAEYPGRMGIQVRQLGSEIGAEVSGVDVRHIDDETFDAIYRAWLDSKVLVLPGQELEIDEFLQYSRRFGVLEPHPSKSTRHPEYPEITMLGANKWEADGTLNM